MNRRLLTCERHAGADRTSGTCKSTDGYCAGTWSPTIPALATCRVVSRCRSRFVSTPKGSSAAAGAAPKQTERTRTFISEKPSETCSRSSLENHEPKLLLSTRHAQNIRIWKLALWYKNSNNQGEMVWEGPAPGRFWTSRTCPCHRPIRHDTVPSRASRMGPQTKGHL